MASRTASRILLDAPSLEPSLATRSSLSVLCFFECFDAFFSSHLCQSCSSAAVRFDFFVGESNSTGFSAPPALPAPLMATPVNGLIGIELPSGIKVTVDAAVDVDVLSRVIGALTR